MKSKVLSLLMIFSLMCLLAACSKDKEKEVPKDEFFAYSVDDIIINPSGADAERIMLASVSLELKSDAEVTTAKEKAPLIKDLIVTTLSSKTIEKLTQSGYKDSLKVELKNKLKARVKDLNIKNIYFTKYIVQ